MGRIIGVLLTIAGLAVAVMDLLATPQGGGVMLRPIGEYWYKFNADSLLLLQPALERHVSPFLWNPVMLTFLQWPLALVCLGLGFVLLFLGLVRR